MKNKYHFPFLKRLIYRIKFHKAYSKAVSTKTFSRWLEVVTWTCFLQKMGCIVHTVWYPKWNSDVYAFLRILEPDDFSEIKNIRIYSKHPMTIYQFMDTKYGTWKYDVKCKTIEKI